MHNIQPVETANRDRVCAIVGVVLITLSMSSAAQTPSAVLAPTGTLRAIYLGTNPVHGRTDPRTGAATGPVPDLVQELARTLKVPYAITPAPDAAGVIAALTGGKADIGFLAYDASRAREVDFGAPFIVMFNSYVVRADSSIRQSADVDRAGVTVGAVKGQTQELFVSSNLKSAKIQLFPTMPPQAEVEKLLTGGDVDAFAVNRQRALDAEAASGGRLRALADSFLAVNQAFVVPKGDRAKLPIIERFVSDARTSGFIKAAIDRAKLTGVDVAR
jgi:polar amino acid transport system substrate-binding protein